MTLPSIFVSHPCFYHRNDAGFSVFDRNCTGSLIPYVFEEFNLVGESVINIILYSKRSYTEDFCLYFLDVNIPQWYEELRYNSKSYHLPVLTWILLLIKRDLQ